MMYRQTRSAWCFTAAAVLAAVLMASSAYGQGTWTTLAPLPAATEGMTVGGVGDVIITAYGFTSVSGDSNLTRLYNIASDTWSLGAPAPLPVSSEQAYGETTHGGLFYVAGGRSGAVLNRLVRYDPATNTWTTLASMPTARAAAAAAVQDNGLFVIGGRLSPGGPCSGGPYLTTVERYDIDTDTWSTLAPLPSPRSDFAAVAHGGKIYVFGGCNGLSSGFLADVDVYDPVTNTWSTTPANMPTARASLAAGKVGNRVFAIGGYAGGPPLNVNEVYNIARDAWAADAPMLTARGEAGAHSHGGRVYVVGGGQPAFGTPTAANEVFKP